MDLFALTSHVYGSCMHASLWTLLTLLLAPPAIAAGLPLQQLALTHVGADQGVFVQAEDGTILAAQRETRPVHPASVTKVATSLALLARLGPDYRFETQVFGDGPLRNGRLDGDLVVEANGDPFFVFEDAFLILRKLHALGLREVRGDVRVRGPWMFNWQDDPAARRLKRALQGLDGAEAWAALGESRVCLSGMALRFRPAPAPQAAGKTLLRYHSPPLLTIVKALNGYSNNVFHPLSDRIGGAQAVEASMRAHLPAALGSEVTITNAAGADENNRVSPRAAVAILWQLQTYLRTVNRQLSDVLPVNGSDLGTLQERLLEAPYRGRVVGKTGTFGSVGASALVGVLRTPEYGRIAFAVLNSWVPVPEARQRQDAFVRALIDATHADAWDYAPERKPIFAEARVE